MDEEIQMLDLACQTLTMRWALVVVVEDLWSRF